ncbi:MAG TPA: cytidylate kinase family protein [Chloroflexota bacterium]|nr:cytidylate kinase family protein [Chloroflexota bacterium]
MSIISISRGSLAAGQTVAEILAERLGYRCVGSEALVEAATQHGVSDSEVTKLLETRPGFWERLSASKEWYVTVLSAAMCDIARDGKLVYHGLAGQELLRGVDHILKVRVVAPMPQRVQYVMDAQKLSADGAKKWIENVDEDRFQRMRYLFGIDWRDPLLYDAILNLGNMSNETAAGVLAELASQPAYQPTPQSVKQMNDLAISSRVKATVLEQFPGAAVEVKADDGVVWLTGNVQALGDEREPLVRAVKALPGVRAVHAELGFQAMPYVHP